MFIIIFIGCDTGILLLLGVGAGAVEEVLGCGEEILLYGVGAVGLVFLLCFDVIDVCLYY